MYEISNTTWQSQLFSLSFSFSPLLRSLSHSFSPFPSLPLFPPIPTLSLPSSSLLPLTLSLRLFVYVWAHVCCVWCKMYCVILSSFPCLEDGILGTFPNLEWIFYHFDARDFLKCWGLILEKYRIRYILYKSIIFIIDFSRILCATCFRESGPWHLSIGRTEQNNTETTEKKSEECWIARVESV